MMEESEKNTEYTVMCTYFVIKGEEARFEELLEKHWPTLRKLNLVTEKPAEIYKREAAEGNCYIEIMTWVRPDAAQEAYQKPEIKEIWGPLFDDLTEERDGRPAIEYPQVKRMKMSFSL